MTSAQIQNELLQTMAFSIICDVAYIRDAKYFAIMADEVTDASNREHASVGLTVILSPIDFCYPSQNQC